MSPVTGKKAIIGGTKKSLSTVRKAAGLFITHTEFKAQDGPFMMMGTG